MDNVCYTVIIRQQVCQSGVPVTRENAYSNISQNSIITLLNGYTLHISLSSGGTVNLRFMNTLFGIDIIFNILENTLAVFDLPVENTIYRVSIFVKSRCCNLEQESCCNRR